MRKNSRKSATKTTKTTKPAPATKPAGKTKSAGKVTPQVPAPAGSTPLGLPTIVGAPASTKQEAGAVAMTTEQADAIRADVKAGKLPLSKLVGLPAAVEAKGKGKTKGEKAGTVAGSIGTKYPDIKPATESAPAAPAAGAPAKAQDAPQTPAPAPAMPAPAPVTLKTLEGKLDEGYKLMDSLLAQYEKATRDVLKLELQIEALTTAPVTV